MFGVWVGFHYSFSGFGETKLTLRAGQGDKRTATWVNLSPPRAWIKLCSSRPPSISVGLVRNEAGLPRVVFFFSSSKSEDNRHHRHPSNDTSQIFARLACAPAYVQQYFHFSEARPTCVCACIRATILFLPLVATGKAYSVLRPRPRGGNASAFRPNV